MSRKKPNTSELAAETAPEPAVVPAPEGMLALLGIVGMEEIEPVVLAALTQRDPLLLIGPHGVGKSYLLNRLAAALGLQHRHYNASLLNFDDLVGYPLPNARGGLDYIQTPASIWGAQSVFLDEISRCRPDIQNKLFSIIHDRRVQGLPLDALVYRWSAMNPPPTGDAEPLYAGCEPLDTALADGFPFILELPGWRRLRPEVQERLILTADAEPDPAAAGRPDRDRPRAGGPRPRFDGGSVGEVRAARLRAAVPGPNPPERSPRRHAGAEHSGGARGQAGAGARRGPWRLGLYRPAPFAAPARHR